MAIIQLGSPLVLAMLFGISIRMFNRGRPGHPRRHIRIPADAVGEL
jgi:hypothetical protein